MVEENGLSGVSLTPKKTRRRRGHSKRETLVNRGFTLFKRKGSKVWYFYTLEEGKRQAHSTRTEDYEKAREAAREYLHPTQRTETTLEDFTSDFFVWGKCKWIAAQHAAGRSFSQGAAAGRRSQLTTWILPTFGKRTLTSITPRDIRDWIISLPLSGQSKNHLKYCLKIIFSEAVFAELIERNPVEGIRNVALNRKVRDPFTLEDLALLFPEDTGKLLEIWKDAEHAALYMMLAACGLRSGEARALEWRHLKGPVMISMGEGKETPRYFLLVEQAVKFATGRTIGGTKAGKPRPVYLPERARGCLEWWRPQCPWRESTDLMFPSTERGIPMGDQALRDRLKAAMKRAGVEPGQRTLTVHGFRHGYVTRSKRTLPTDLLLLMAGHADEKVQSGYVHPRLEDQLEQIGQAADTIEGTWPGSLILAKDGQSR